MYNAPASHLAAMLRVDGATYTLVGDGTVGLQALEFGAQLIATDDADHVLVVAAEEFDAILSEAHGAWRLVPNRADAPPGRGVPLAEGAAAVLLSRDAGNATVTFAEGRTHFSRDDAPEMMRQALAEIADCGVPDVVVTGANGTWADVAIGVAMASQFPNGKAISLMPKLALGECLGAGALLQVVIALEELRRAGGQRALVVALGWNQQAAAAFIERTAC